MDRGDDDWLSQEGGWIEDENTQSENELSQALTDFENSQSIESPESAQVKRFASTSANEISALVENRIPGKTKSNTKWGFNIWVEWAMYKNKNLFVHEPYMSVPLDFVDISAKELDYWLQFFYVDIRKKNGQQYPPKTVYQIACAILRHIRENCCRLDLNFLNEHDENFRKSWRVLDSEMKRLHSEGLGAEITRACAVTVDDEKLLWDRNVVAFDNAEGLSYGVFFYNCKCFGMRGRDEHRALEPSQYKIGTDASGRYVQFIGRESKNTKCGIKQRQIENKNIKQHSNDDDPSRCVVKLFEVYLSHIPSEGPFYRRPLSPTNSEQIRFSSQSIGVHTLKTYMNRMFTKAGLPDKYTNHSGKVTAATTLFSNGLEKDLVQRRTAHRSDAVLHYRRPSETTLKRMSDLLQPPTSSKLSKKSDDIQTSATEDGKQATEATISFRKGDTEIKFTV